MWRVNNLESNISFIKFPNDAVPTMQCGIWWFILVIYNNEHGISDVHLFNQTSAIAAVQMQFSPQTHTGKKKSDVQ